MALITDKSMGSDAISSSDTKVCSTCKIEKGLDSFYPRKNKCKTCIKQYRNDNKEKLSKQRKKYREIHKEEISQNAKIYHEENREDHIIYQRKYRKDNKEQIKESNKVYCIKNKTKVLKTKNKYKKMRMKTDPVFKIREYISRAIHGALKSNGSSKEGYSIAEYLPPFYFDKLNNHIESLFEPWMTWENQGVYKPSSWDDNDSSTWKWQLDHIIPQSDLLYSSMEDDNFKKCWDLSNLRPLSAKQNILDGSTRSRHKKK